LQEQTHNEEKKNERTTIGLAIGWQTEEQSATNQYQQQFWPTNINQLLIVNFNFCNSIGLWFRA